MSKIDSHSSQQSTSRLQLALDASHLDEAFDFYTKFFLSAPTRVEPGYANLPIADPPLKLVHFEDHFARESINYFGVEVFSTHEVEEATEGLAAGG